MITIDKEFYSSPYYFFLRDKGNDYSLYYSVEETLTEARKKDVMMKIPKDKVEVIKKYLNIFERKKLALILEYIFDNISINVIEKEGSKDIIR